MVKNKSAITRRIGHDALPRLSKPEAAGMSRVVPIEVLDTSRPHRLVLSVCTMCPSRAASRCCRSGALERVCCVEFFPPGNPLPAWGHKGSILGPGEGHEAHKGNGEHPRFTWRDLFNHGELLWRFNGPQRHDKPATHFELFNQRRRDMPKCGRDDYRVERTAFQPSVITVADFDAGQWRDNLNSTNLPRHTRQYCGLVA